MRFVLTTDNFATKKLRRLPLPLPFMANATTAITTPQTDYVTQSRIVRQMNTNSKMFVSPVLLVVLLAKQQTC